MIESIEQNGRTIYRHQRRNGLGSRSGDRAAFYQLKSMLQGVVARGTASAIELLCALMSPARPAPATTRTTRWFVGFTNEVTVAVWVGYDNADGKRRTLGGGATGGKVAVPIFEPAMQAVAIPRAANRAGAALVASAPSTPVSVPINYLHRRSAPLADSECVHRIHAPRLRRRPDRHPVRSGVADRSRVLSLRAGRWL